MSSNSMDDPRHIVQNAVRYNLARMHAWRSAGAGCPSDEYSCHNLDDNPPLPIVFSASIGKSDPGVVSPGDPAAGRVFTLEVRRASI